MLFARLPSLLAHSALKLQTTFVNQVRHASKAGTGVGGVCRTSRPKSRGVKVLGDQPVKSGSIIVRQLGRRYLPGENAGIGRDDTIYAKIDGFVEFQRVRRPKPRHYVHVRDHNREEHTEQVAKRVALRNTDAQRRRRTWQFTVDEPVEDGLASSVAK